MERRLSAVLAADVAGYSALMAQDEPGTLAALNELLKNVLNPLIARHHGRIVKLMGDGLLAEFASVVDAVEFAVAFQTACAAFRGGRFQMRVGINLGDIIIEDGDIFGDGVIVAARLEGLAAPGEICVSGIVKESLGNKVPVQLADDGEHRLKNIPQPVRVFRWAVGQPVPAAGEQAAPARSGKPAIAVLAFDNMSGDPGQEYFSDGIAEDIITELSHFREFSVIARNSTFTFKGQTVRVDQICRDLGVRYLVEGSVRKAGQQVRVTAQLIDGETNAHLWAGKFDRELNDIFAVQDEITQAVVGAVAPETLGAELKRSRSKGGQNLSAWDRVLQARWHLGQFSQDGNIQARRLLEAAIAGNPGLADAHASLAHCDLMDMLHLWCSDVPLAIKSAAAAGRTAVTLDDGNAEAHAMLGLSLIFGRSFEAGESHLNRAVELNPNLANGYGIMTALHGLDHRLDRARVSFATALRLSPHDPLKAFWLGGLGIGAYVAEEYEECVEITRRGLKDHPGYASLMRQEAAALGMLGRSAEAGEALERLLRRMPGLTLSRVRHMVPVRRPDDHERWLEGLRRAGLPE